MQSVAEESQIEDEASEKHPLPIWAYKLLLLSATLMWGFSFFVMKNAVDVIPPAFLLAFRFFICGVLMALFFWKRMRA